MLDEPSSHIDNFRKNELRRNLFAYRKDKNIACIVATHDANDVLPFSDKTIVIKDGEIIANEATQVLFQNPKNIYVANLFAEANLVSIAVLKTYANVKRKIVVYAHEFLVSDKSGIPVEVENSYSMGTHFLIEGKAAEQSLFFNSHKAYEIGSKAYLNIPIDIINKRLA